MKNIKNLSRKERFLLEEKARLAKKTSYLVAALTKTFKISDEELLAGRGTVTTTPLRWVLWSTLRRGGATFEQIAEVTNKHHSTVVFHLKKSCPKGYEKLFVQLIKTATSWEKRN